MILPGFEHRPGVHCGSTAVADVLRLAGVDLSEPMAFGLGAGLGFHHVTSPTLSPSRMFHGRSEHLERVACEAMGLRARERTEEDSERAWEGLRAALGRGIAPIVSTDLAELPYWHSSTPFGGHRVVVAGHDANYGVAFLADTGFPGLQEVPVDVLQRARAKMGFPLGAPDHPWIEVLPGAGPVPLTDAVPEALRRQARDMLLDRDGSAGVSAIERLAEDLPGWTVDTRDEHDFVRCVLYAYQMIERRGSDGGLFRSLYAKFLAEAEDLLPSLRRLGLRSRMVALAGRWSAIAGAMRDAARESAVPATLPELVREVAREERRFYEDVEAGVP